jgi:uncharacterized integral membrane protein
MANYWENLTFWKKTKFIFTIILSVFVIIFAVINWKSVLLDFVFGGVYVSLTLLILICLLVGYLIASLFESKHYNGKVKEIVLLENEIEALKADKNELKTQIKNMESAAVSPAHNPTDLPNEENF